MTLEDVFWKDKEKLILGLAVVSDSNTWRGKLRSSVRQDLLCFVQD